MAIVSVGQITLVDNNDARPLTAYLTVSPGPQQVFSKDESTVSYSPDWTQGSGLVITAKVFAGAMSAAEEVTGQLSNRRFTLDLTTGITGTNAAISSNTGMNNQFATGTYTVLHDASSSVFTVKANLKDTVPQVVVYFEGDYQDPVTGLVSRIVAQITLGLVKTGTNAVYLLTRGSSSIEQASGGTKNVVALSADLIRAAGVDTTSVTYQWFKGATQIISSAPFTTQFGLKTVASPTIPTGSQSEIGVNLPASNAWSAHNTLVVHESGVTDMQVFRVVARDADTKTYQAYFTIYDISDPYEVRILSSAGEKFQNGVGSTQLTPDVFYGATRVTDLSGWTFSWSLRDRNGNRAAFVDTTKTALAGGRLISGNTATAFTYGGTAISFAATDLIKAFKPDGTARFFEVASATGNTVTIKTSGFTHAGIDFTSYPQPTASEFVNGRLFACTTNGGRLTTTAAASITVTGDDIDVKGSITVEADRP